MQSVCNYHLRVKITNTVLFNEITNTINLIPYNETTNTVQAYKLLAH